MKGILNVKDFHFEIPEIKKYSNSFGESRIKETIERQEELFKTFKNVYNIIRTQHKLPHEIIKTNSFKRIQYLVDYAFENVPFYRDFYGKAGFEKGAIRNWSDFERLPILTKTLISENFPNNVAINFDLNSLYGVRTSGSSGIPLTIVLDDYRAHIDTLNRIRQFEILAGSSISEKSWIYNIHHSAWWYTSMTGYFPTFTLRQNCPVEPMAEHILKLKPAVISGLPSVLMDLALYLKEKKIILKDFGIQCVSTNSEASSKQERQLLQKIFEVPVGDEYSSEELGLIATECNFGNYHIVEDECYIEIMNLMEKNDSFGQIIGTDLWNLAMPIIRYNQGDLANNVHLSDCPCGSQHRILSNFEGRSDQNFLTVKNKIISSSQLLDICDEFLVPNISNIKEFKLVQEKYDHIILYCTKKIIQKNINETSIAHFKNKLSELMQNTIKFECISCEIIPENLSYKRMMLISKINK